MAPIAGSRDTLSYVVRALDVSQSNGGISHGAGRKYDRKSMHGRAGVTKSEREALRINPWGGTILCDDRDLMIEEAATAYKDAGKVVSDLQSFGLVDPIAAMKPMMTYKNVRPEGVTSQRKITQQRSNYRRSWHD